MSWITLGGAFLVFCLRLTDVAMGTIRTTMIIRGQRKWAALVGFFEVTIWIVAVSRVIANLDTIWNVLGYSGGFAAGTLLGMWIEGRLALGHVEVSIVSLAKGPEISSRARRAGYGATLLRAEGQSGPVFLISVVAPRRRVADLVRLVNEVDATAFLVVEDTRQVVRGYRRLVK